MNVGEILVRVQRQFGDSASIQINDTDVIRWVNDAQKEIAMQNQLLQTVSTTAIVVGQQDYTLPPDILTMRSVRYQGKKLQFLNTNEAEQYVVTSAENSTTGTPSNFWTWANKISLWPIPDTAGTSDLQLFYTRQPIDVTADSDVPELPLQYHNRIVEYCLQQAYELDENWTAAQTKGQQFAQGVNQLKDNVDWVDRDFYPMITSTDVGES